MAGEAGIGKTRLAAEIAAGMHGDGGVVLWGQCDDDAMSPFQPFAEALTRYFRDMSPLSLEQLLGSDVADVVRIVPALAERLSDLTPSLVTDLDAGRDRVFAALSETLRRIAASQPVLLVLDDLHRARPSALAALRSLARQVHDTRLLIVATCRDTDVDDDHALVAVLADLTRDDVVDLVTLRGLEQDEVRQLAAPEAFTVAADDGAAALDRLHERTGGNPFFCIQLLRQAATGGRSADDVRHRLG